MKFLVLLCLVACVAADSDGYYDDYYKYPGRYGPSRYYGKYEGGYYPDDYRYKSYGKNNYRYDYHIYYPWERAHQGKYESNYGWPHPRRVLCKAAVQQGQRRLRHQTRWSRLWQTVLVVTPQGPTTRQQLLW
ncbi:uncharacterized protein LOC119095449 isoform X1 [Pollicipes pollicipes]|uniref:uncharacterized protein LOC119095449 isoform X1 n=1 Tax=Pollicipes pollicipes TaxID=41117 RepID=UPI00188535AE|nr:uncharacterized protein LOC119095449 isoform X1 [Pollicipes pollicipes]